MNALGLILAVGMGTLAIACLIMGLLKAMTIWLDNKDDDDGKWLT